MLTLVEFCRKSFTLLVKANSILNLACSTQNKSEGMIKKQKKKNSKFCINERRQLRPENCTKFIILHQAPRITKVSLPKLKL